MPVTTTSCVIVCLLFPHTRRAGRGRLIGRSPAPIGVAALPYHMAFDDPVRVNGSLAVPLAELTMRATRSGGPGGQHVNTSSTRIELVWSVTTSPSLTEAQRARLLEKLANRIDGQGQLRLVAQGERSQLQNREAAVRRFVDVVRRGLAVPRARRPTRPTKASKERRLKEKKARGALKRERRKTDD
ncbi:MAG TPA: alternative ribosome rescue aminoacyl-tRNA hydrolase ArfB [Gemmatimonadales bacterium]|nr:alternative ribosome rescue aminoacyl-tRNA hydrolase ArfB [Gemmatimonadales bacterium]HRX18299.1 alternative ribosome rescue aminoacyl-tRNA hydrolase ArfB [Gemmatimonadales bacterium]